MNTPTLSTDRNAYGWNKPGAGDTSIMHISHDFIYIGRLMAVDGLALELCDTLRWFLDGQTQDVQVAAWSAIHALHDTAKQNGEL